MRIRKKKITSLRSRRPFGFDRCETSICQSWTHQFWIRKFVLPLMILIGFGLTTTLMTLAPSQQLQYVNWESSLISIPIKEAANVMNDPNFSHKSTSSSTIRSRGSSNSTYSDIQNFAVNPNIVIRWDHWKDMERIVDSIWGGSLFCKTVKQSINRYYNEVNSSQAANAASFKQIPIPNIYVHLEFSCQDLYKHSKHGTGNYIQAIYFMRLAVKYTPNVRLKLNVTCIENNSPEFYTNYVLPWFTGVWYTPNTTAVSRFIDRIRILLHTQRYQSYRRSMHYDNYCGYFKANPTAILYREMQYDVRRMAIALVGTQPFLNDDDSTKIRRRPLSREIEIFLRDNIYEEPLDQNIIQYARNDNSKMMRSIHQNVSLRPGTAHERINTKTTNIVPLIQLQQPNNKIIFDDAVIHFRCGDLLSTRLVAYGFLTFHGYSRHISSSVQSIGILTQPFGKVKNGTNTDILSKVGSTVAEGTGQQATLISDQERSLDTNDEIIARRCRTLVYAFQEYLEEKFPKARVQIRNDRSETIALAYARMVMAKQVVGSMSTFSIYPIIGTFGTGYYLRPKIEDPSYWVANNIYPVTKIWDIRTVIFNEKAKLLGTQTKDIWDAYGDDVVLEWFRTGTYTTNVTSASS